MLSGRDFENWEEPLIETIESSTKKLKSLDEYILNHSPSLSEALIEAYKEKSDDNNQKNVKLVC